MQAIFVELAQLGSNENYATLICFFPEDFLKIIWHIHITWLVPGHSPSARGLGQLKGAQRPPMFITWGVFATYRVSTILWTLIRITIQISQEFTSSNIRRSSFFAFLFHLLFIIIVTHITNSARGDDLDAYLVQETCLVWCIMIY